MKNYPVLSKSRNSPHFMEPEGSLPHSQVPAICPYPEAARSTPYHPTSHFLKIHLNIILSSTPGSPQWSLCLIFPHQNLVYASPCHPYALHAPPISFQIRTVSVSIFMGVTAISHSKFIYSVLCSAELEHLHVPSLLPLASGKTDRQS